MTGGGSPGAWCTGHLRGLRKPPREGRRSAGHAEGRAGPTARARKPQSRALTRLGHTPAGLGAAPPVKSRVSLHTRASFLQPDGVLRRLGPGLSTARAAPQPAALDAAAPTGAPWAPRLPHTRGTPAPSCTPSMPCSRVLPGPPPHFGGEQLGSFDDSQNLILFKRKNNKSSRRRRRAYVPSKRKHLK